MFEYRAIGLHNLPATGTQMEGETFDGKVKYHSSNVCEAAKDLSSFANHLGGTILVGAQYANGVISNYVPLTDQEFTDTERKVEDACTKFCSPRLAYGLESIPIAGGRVMAVNVPPSLQALVGVKVSTDKQKCGFGGDAWRFVRRVGSHTNEINPESLHMFMNPSVRRAVIMLNKIPKDAPAVKVVVTYSRSHAEETRNFDLEFSRVEPEENRVVFLQKRNKKEQAYPLDRILTVYRPDKEAPHWHVLVDSVPPHVHTG